MFSGGRERVHSLQMGWTFVKNIGKYWNKKHRHEMGQTGGGERQVNRVCYSHKEHKILFIKISKKSFLIIITTICVGTNGTILS